MPPGWKRHGYSTSLCRQYVSAGWARSAGAGEPLSARSANSPGRALLCQSSDYLASILSSADGPPLKSRPWPLPEQDGPFDRTSIRNAACTRLARQARAQREISRFGVRTRVPRTARRIALPRKLPSGRCTGGRREELGPSVAPPPESLAAMKRMAAAIRKGLPGARDATGRSRRRRAPGVRAPAGHDPSRLQGTPQHLDNAEY